MFLLALISQNETRVEGVMIADNGFVNIGGRIQTVLDPRLMAITVQPEAPPSKRVCVLSYIADV